MPGNSLLQQGNTVGWHGASGITPCLPLFGARLKVGKSCREENLGPLINKPKNSPRETLGSVRLNIDGSALWVVRRFECQSRLDDDFSLSA